MKKFLLSLMCIGAAATISLAAQETTYKADFVTDATTIATAIKSKTTASLTINNIEWSFTNATTNGSSAQKDGSGRGLQIGSSKNTPATVTFSTEAFNGNSIKEVTLTLAGNGGTFDIAINGTKVNSGNNSYNASSGTSTITASWTGNVACKTGFSIAITAKTGKALFISSFVVKYAKTETGKTDPELRFAQEAYSALLGKAFESPKATQVGDGAITYKSSNEAVATVDTTTGDVTIVGEGVTTITATVAETDTYDSQTASYSLTVTDPSILYTSEMGADFSLENVTDQTYPWSHDKQYGLKGTAFISGTTHACTGIACSPVIDLTGIDYNNAELNFMTAFNNYKINNNTINIADFKGYAEVVVREEGAAEWSVLGEPTAPAEFSWTFYANEPMSLGAYVGKKIQIGFKYISTTECAGTWEVKAINIKGINTPDAPTAGAGEETNPASISLTDAAPTVTVTLTAAEGSDIWFKFIAAAEPAPAAETDRDGFEPYTAPIEISKAGTLLYYAEKDGIKSTIKQIAVSDNTTAISEIEAAGAAAEWFDLSGRKVAAPAKGIYIRRQGGKAVKVTL